MLQASRRVPDQEKQMENAQSQFAETLGYRTHYIEEGSGEAVVLIHGGGAGADCRGNWSACWPHFAAEHRTIAYDMVGFGHSDAPDPAGFGYTQDARIAQLAAFLDALHLEKVNLVGNSMGGCTALGLAMRHPARVQNLVLMGSAGLNRSLGGPLAAIVNYDFTLEGMRAIVAALTAPGFRADEKQIRSRYELSLRPATKVAYVATMGWIRQQGGLHYPDEEIAKVTTRTLVVNGKNDRVVPVGDAYRFLELLENASGAIIAHCGHWAMIEHSALFAEIANQFLRN
jgi:pimeloyl-ACP methyl ester carboxylesterase